MFRRRLTPLLAGVLPVLLALGACGGSSTKSKSVGSHSGPQPSVSSGFNGWQTGYFNSGDQAVKPVSGGVLHFSELSPTLDLDPDNNKSGGALGGQVMAAIFDTLMRYDNATNAYRPQMAKSLSHNSDFTSWTLKLRDGVKFTDGTPVDAHAVAYSVQRYAASPTAIFSAQAKLISGYETPDASTVVFKLSQAWSMFPFLLSLPMVVSPTAANKMGKGFAKDPVGAGAFKVQSFQPGERIVLVRNDGYWGGKPYLDGVTFTSVATGPGTLDSINTGGVQIGFITDTKTMHQAISAGLPGFVTMVGSQGLLPNARSGATANPKVRLAIQSALNLSQINERVASGVGAYGSAVLWKDSPWNPGVPGPAYDPTKAKSLIEQAQKETGWDGSIEILSSSQSNPASALAVQAQLNAVGFKAKIKNVPTFNDLVRQVFVEHNFQLTDSGLNMWAADPAAQLYQNLDSHSSRNTSGYKNAELDNLIEKLMATAPDPNLRKPIFKQIQELFNTQAPFIVEYAVPYGVVWTKNVHGVVASSGGLVLLDKAFMTK